MFQRKCEKQEKMLAMFGISDTHSNRLSFYVNHDLIHLIF